MESDLTRFWTWSEAFEMLDRAERMHRQFFRRKSSVAAVVWEPPVDVLETERAVLILVALPGVDLNEVDASIEGDELFFSGTRTFPAEMQTAVIHRLELPQGRFERRVRLPPGRYASIHRSTFNGCILITLQKAGGSHG
jgi:HSP20 family protein